MKLALSKVGDYIKVSTEEIKKDNFIFQEKTSPKVEIKTSNRTNTVSKEEKSIPKKKIIKQELSKDNFIKELKKIFEEISGGKLNGKNNI